MISNIRTILTPLLIISFVSGLRIVEFSTNRWKARFCLLYVLLLWSIYFFLLLCIVLSYIHKYNVDFIIFSYLNICISLISVIFGVRYNKRFIKCLEKIAIVDDILEQLGTTTDYQKLHTRIIWFIFGWLIMVILIIYVEIIYLRQEYDYSIAIASCNAVVIIYCSHINFINDLITANILGYIGLKFDQINENLRKLTNTCGIKQAWEDHVLHSRQRRHLKTSSNKRMTWIVIHLHLELRKISREIDSMFGVQLTFKMGLYFGLVASCLREILSIILVNNYVKRKIIFCSVILFWNIVYAFQVFLINYICEKVSFKANTIGSFITGISYSNYDVEVRENILQILLQVTQLPLRFYGIGLFQFGFKFLYGFSTSVVTVVVILLQAHVNKYY